MSGKSILLFLILLASTFISRAQEDTLLLSMMRNKPELFDSILKNAESMNVQIIYTQVNRDKKNRPHLKQYTFNVDPNRYFYPASLVKLPVSALSLEKINKLKKLGYKDLDKFSRLQIDSAYRCQTSVKTDTSSGDKYPSVGHYIKKMMLVSDNDAYSRLYEFLGQEYVNQALWDKGYDSIRIIHRFVAKCDTNANRFTNSFTFFDSSGNEIYKQPAKESAGGLKNPLAPVKMGTTRYDAKGKVIHEPKDFSYSNYLNLKDITSILISLIFPETLPEKQRFDLNKEDYKFMQKYMSMYPRESIHPVYGKKRGYNDTWKKYLIYGTFKDTVDNKNLRIFNIVGLSYGVAADIAYVVDFENNVEFFLSAVIYANKDGLFNGKYQYNTVAMPFMVNLGKMILEYEKTRKRDYKPDLEEFKFDYTKE